MSQNAIPETAAQQRRQFAAAYAVLEAGIGEYAFPGAAFGVMLGRSVLALDGVGHFTYPGPTARGPAGNAAPSTAGDGGRGRLLKDSVTPFTTYDLASVTKVVATTAAAMLLHDRGILDLEEPLGDILPGFVIGMEPGSGKDRVTLRMLLAHCSGLPAYAKLYESHSTPQHVMRACLRLPLAAEPGARAEYSDLGFILLGTALEVLSGQKLASLCEREVFGPLGMTSTRYCPLPESHNEIPPTELDTPLRHRLVQGEVHDENCFALGGAAGHAGLFSNAGDVLRFAECILAGGQVPSRRASDAYPLSGPDEKQQPTGRAQRPGPQLFDARLFRRATVDLFAARQEMPPGTSRALGWDTPTQPSSSGTLFGANAIGHLGYTGTSLWIDRDRELAVVLLTNRTWPDRNRPAESWDAIRKIRPLFHNAILSAL